MYMESPEGQIHADFARRAGELLLQYERFKQNLPVNDRYEATLAMSLLQSLSTSFKELSQNAMPESFKKFLALPIDELPPRMGLDPKAVDWSWRALGTLQYRHLMDVIRHSLSHPLPQKKNARWPVTGYTAIATTDGQIGAYRFTQSPWMGPSGRVFKAQYCARVRDEKEQERQQEMFNKFQSEYKLKAGTIGTVVRAGMLLPAIDGEEFVPVITIELNTQQLRLFTLELADLIASAGHPTHLRWQARQPA